MRRGEVWTVSGDKDDVGKPLPVVIVQDDPFDGTESRLGDGKKPVWGKGFSRWSFPGARAGGLPSRGRRSLGCFPGRYRFPRWPRGSRSRIPGSGASWGITRKRPTGKKREARSRGSPRAPLVAPVGSPQSACPFQDSLKRSKKTLAESSPFSRVRSPTEPSKRPTGGSSLSKGWPEAFGASAT